MTGATSLENAVASLQGAAWSGRIYRVMLKDRPFFIWRRGWDYSAAPRPFGAALTGVIPASWLSRSTDPGHTELRSRLAERVGFEPTCRNYPTIRFRVGAVMTTSVPLRLTYDLPYYLSCFWPYLSSTATV